MADEFLEHDLDTPTEQDLDQAYGSKFLSSTDVGNRKIRTKIARVRKEELRDGDAGKKKIKFVIYFKSLDKGLILNATNKNALADAFGKVPAKWIGAEVGVFVDPNVTFAGKRVPGLRLRVLLPATASKPATAPAAKPAAAASDEWPEEKGDPGFDPDLNDSVPDLSAA